MGKEVQIIVLAIAFIVICSIHCKSIQRQSTEIFSDEERNFENQMVKRSVGDAESSSKWKKNKHRRNRSQVWQIQKKYVLLV